MKSCAHQPLGSHAWLREAGYLPGPCRGCDLRFKNLRGCFCPWPPGVLALANTVAEEASAPPLEQSFAEVQRAPATVQPRLAA